MKFDQMLRNDAVDVLMSNDEKFDSVFEKDFSDNNLSPSIYAEASLYMNESKEPSIEEIAADAVDNTVEDAYSEDNDPSDIVNIAADEIHDEMDLTSAADMDFGDMIDAVMDGDY